MTTIKYILNLIGSYGDFAALIVFVTYALAYNEVPWMLMGAYFFGRIVGNVSGYTFAFDAVEKELKKKGLI